MSAELIAHSSDLSLMRVGLPFAGPSAENTASPLALRPSAKAQALAPWHGWWSYECGTG